MRRPSVRPRHVLTAWVLRALLYFEHNARRLGRAGLEHVTQTMRSEGLRDVVGGAGEKMRERFKRDRSED